jgi:pimeloyl-ACP methyl ester carboxylesterase
MTQEVFELHNLLQAAKIPTPYVLVGHSIGGLLVRLYTEQYGKDVIGLVLVDPTHKSNVLFTLEKWSGRLDSNQRPPAPKAGMLRIKIGP